jgi:hypothetical protein
MDSPFSFAASNEHILNQLFDVLLNLGVVSGQKQYQYNYRALPNC